MSQPRGRKAFAAAGGGGARAREPVVRTQGDCDDSPQHQNRHERSRSKNKIPKSMRYDLENALLSLCDVWFEEIKPHLERNRIKVHVHESGQGLRPRGPAGVGPAAAAGGDQRGLPPGALGCSHLDPAATWARCELCKLLYHAARGIESAVSQAAATLTATGKYSHWLRRQKIQWDKCDKRDHRSPPRPLPPPPPPPSPPSLQRRLGSVCLASPADLVKALSFPARHTRRKSALHVTAPHHGESYEQQCYKRKPDMMNQCTQTPQYSAALSVRAAARLPLPASTRITAVRSSTAAHIVAQNKARSRRRQTHHQQPLFPDDLIDIISENHDKQLKLFYKNPRNIEYPSVMNLMKSVRALRRSGAGAKKKPPWK